jgi:hypothetical protein
MFFLVQSSRMYSHRHGSATDVKAIDAVCYLCLILLSIRLYFRGIGEGQK